MSLQLTNPSWDIGTCIWRNLLKLKSFVTIKGGCWENGDLMMLLSCGKNIKWKSWKKIKNKTRTMRKLLILLLGSFFSRKSRNISWKTCWTRDWISKGSSWCFNSKKRNNCTILTNNPDYRHISSRRNSACSNKTSNPTKQRKSIPSVKTSVGLAMYNTSRSFSARILLRKSTWKDIPK